MHDAEPQRASSARLGDIEGLIDARPEIDLDRVRHWLCELASVFDMPEIQKDFERMLRRKRQA